MESMWWTQLTSSRRILEKVVQALLSSKNIIFTVLDDVPWPNEFRSVLSTSLEKEFVDKTVLVLDVNTVGVRVGSYMLEEFCKKEKRAEYRPNITEGTFLGKCPTLPMDQNIIWVKVKSSTEMNEWLDFIEDYVSAKQESQEKALFVLEADSDFEELGKRRNFLKVNLSSAIPEYIKYTYASVLADEKRVKAGLISYLSMLVAICCHDIELIPLCIDRYSEFLRDPYKTLMSIIKTKKRSNQKDFAPLDDSRCFDKKIWEAQIKVLFPCAEHYRIYIIEKLRRQIESRMQFPYRTNFGDLDSSADLELKDIIFAIANGRIAINDSKEYERLEKIREYRNKLAHVTALSFNEAEFLLEVEAGL